MKTKWYLSTLVILLAFLGICHNQISTPNQEILLQFDSEEVTIEQSQTAIALIKQELQNFGVDNIQIRKEKNGELRISYHSYLNVESIKKTLSKQELGFEFASSKQDEESSNKLPKGPQKNFNLDVYELQKASDSNNSAGKYVLISKQDYDRFLNPNFHPSFIQTEIIGTNESEKPANKVNRPIAIALDNTFYIIPEVRAGPNTSISS